MPNMWYINLEPQADMSNLLTVEFIIKIMFPFLQEITFLLHVLKELYHTNLSTLAEINRTGNLRKDNQLNFWRIQHNMNDRE